MNTNGIAKNYSQLTPMERFCLISAASARGDEVERERLVNAGKRITLTMSDHAPMSDAFDELSALVFIELIEEAARVDNAFHHWNDADMIELIDGKKGTKAPVGENGRTNKERASDLHLAQGFLLQTKAAGWKLFCERWGLSPFGAWHRLPGFERLQRQLQRVDGNADWPGAAFTPEEMVRWLNRNRPTDPPVATEVDIISAERLADELDMVFRTRVEWWGG